MNEFFPEDWSAAQTMAMVPETRGMDMAPDGMPDAIYDGYDGSMTDIMNNPNFVPGYLSTHIGSTVRVEFEIGQGLTDRVGTLLGVGAGFILLQEPTSGATILCDLGPVRFVTIVDEGGGTVLMQ
ncbi:MAG: hypothetical protein FWC62_03570 [Firmicutes bacterium]|nr:hypothetical protein [Bacillota bacterium]